MSNRDEIQVGALRLDPTTGDLRDAVGRRVKLRRKSLAVLTYLAERTDRIVPKSEILDAVWPDVAVSDESLTQCVAEIRKAIGDTDQSVLVTHVGQGYSLDGAAPNDTNIRPRRRVTRAVLAVLLLVVSGALVSWLWFKPPVGDAHPRIAVLAFDDLSAGDDRGYLSDGVAEGLLTELSRYREIRVIARNSSFAYRDSGLGIEKIADDLRADYVIEGSKQKAGDRLRLTVQLIDGQNGTHLWAETYDTDIGDIFDVQTRIVREVTNRIGREITTKPAPSGGRAAVGGLDLYLRGMAEFHKDTRAGTLKAQEFFQQAISAAPEAPFGYVGMTWVLWRDLWSNELDADTPRPEKLRRAAQIADKALSLDPGFHLAHVARADIHVAAGELEQAAVRYDAAAELNPNDVLVLVASSDALVFLGEAKLAIDRIETAIELDPITPDWYFTQLAWAHWSISQCDDGLAALARTATVPVSAFRVKAALQICSGDVSAAREAMDRFRAVDPARTLRTEIDLFGQSWRDPSTMERWAEALRMAGMPE